MGMKKELLDRFATLQYQEPDYFATHKELPQHIGVSLDRCVEKGFSKRDLLNLERMGLVIRGRTYNGQLDFKTNDGKMHVSRNFLGGSTLRYIFIKEDLCEKPVSSATSLKLETTTVEGVSSPDISTMKMENGT